MKLIFNNISDILHLHQNGAFILLNEGESLCYIVDMIVENQHILKQDRETIDELINSGHLNKIGFNSGEMIEILKMHTPEMSSIKDTASIYLAKQFEGTLVTNENCVLELVLKHKIQTVEKTQLLGEILIFKTK